MNAQLDQAEWINTNVYFNYKYSKFKGELHNEMLEVEGANFVLNVNNQLSLKKGWSAEFSGWYRTKGIEGQLTIQPMGQLSVGFANQALKGKGRVKLNLRDIFYTQFATGEIKFKATEVRLENRMVSRVANVTFTYRIGKPLNGSSQRKKRQCGRRVKTED